jgi:hypothetical protein
MAISSSVKLIVKGFVILSFFLIGMVLVSIAFYVRVSPKFVKGMFNKQLSDVILENYLYLCYHDHS